MTRAVAMPPARRTAPPVHRPEGFAPAYDAFEPRFSATDDIALLILGIEDRGGDAAPVRARLLACLGAADGPGVVEHGRLREGYGGGRVELWFAYWRDLPAYARWRGSAGIDELFADPGLLAGDVGLWREHCLMSLDHNETSYSRREDLTGVAGLADALALTEIHGYWGSARDRVAAAADDALPATTVLANARTPAATLGRRVQVTAPANVCLIRSSQDVNRANAEQLAWYTDEVEPTLLGGLRYLRGHREESGCLGAVLVEEQDDAGRDLGRTCVVAYFTSLETLEAWTHRHATHERIMTSFVGMVKRFDGEPGLHLWHEITVFPAGRLTGDYVNCTPDGGLLRFCA